MTFEDVFTILTNEAQKGTLMTAKHNPNNLGVALESYRSVLSYELAEDLLKFINSKFYSINAYENINLHHGKYYIEIIPNANSGFDVPASGVTAYSPYATTTLNRLVLVSGYNHGWHLYGESSERI